MPGGYCALREMQQPYPECKGPMGIIALIEDPQSRVVVPVTTDEVQRLQTANIAADENAILEIVANERRFLYHDMPKGAAETMAWKTRPLFIPGHD